MTIPGLNMITGSSFPVAASVTCDVGTIRVCRVTIDADGPVGAVIDVAVEATGFEDGDRVTILGIVSAGLRDTVTDVTFNPRVYDEWGPMLAGSLDKLRIAAPLAAAYWRQPTSVDVDLRVKAFLNGS